jgi:hypothetical protein
MATNFLPTENNAISIGLKRLADRTVSPELTKKKGKWHQYEAKQWEDIEPRNFMVNNPELFCFDLLGNIQLISCDQGSNEGFIQLFTAMYFHTKKDDRDGQRRLHRLKEVTKIIAMVPRRKSRFQNEPVMKPPGKSDNGMVCFKKCYLVRYCPDGTTPQDTELALNAIAEVRLLKGEGFGCCVLLILTTSQWL